MLDVSASQCPECFFLSGFPLTFAVSAKCTGLVSATMTSDGLEDFVIPSLIGCFVVTIDLPMAADVLDE